MLGAGVFIRLMALETHLVSRGVQLQTVWFMAITTSDPLVIHLALQKRTVHIGFVIRLAVTEIEMFIQQGDAMGITNRLTMNKVFAQL